MNRLCFRLLAMLTFSLFSITSFSQNPAFWAINENFNTTAGTNYLGTNNNTGLDFRTFGQQRMRLTETGRLGLGTTTPLAMFHINGNLGPALSTGEVFRTNTRSTLSTYWRMFRGNEKGAIYNLAGEEHFRLQVA